MKKTWIDCVPAPDEPKNDVHARLNPQTIEDIDAYRRKNRWEYPYLCSTRSLFIETAVRFLLAHLKTPPTAAI